MASHLYNSSLMKGQRTEAAPAEAPAVIGYTEFNFTECRDSTVFFIYRMFVPHIRQCIDIVHFLTGQRQCGRILHDIEFFLAFFNKHLCRKWISIRILCIKTFRIFTFIGTDCIVIRQFHIIVKIVKRFSLVNRSFYISNIMNIHSAV